MSRDENDGRAFELQRVLLIVALHWWEPPPVRVVDPSAGRLLECDEAVGVVVPRPRLSIFPGRSQDRYLTEAVQNAAANEMLSAL